MTVRGAVRDKIDIAQLHNKKPFMGFTDKKNILKKFFGKTKFESSMKNSSRNQTRSPSWNRINTAPLGYVLKSENYTLVKTAQINKEDANFSLSELKEFSNVMQNPYDCAGGAPETSTRQRVSIPASASHGKLSSPRSRVSLVHSPSKKCARPCFTPSMSIR